MFYYICCQTEIGENCVEIMNVFLSYNAHIITIWNHDNYLVLYVVVYR